jgi:hypothetical protein
MKELINDLLAVNCAYNYNPDSDGKCHSTTCMLNTDKNIAEDIQKNGCVIYTKDFVQEIIKQKTKL